MGKQVNISEARRELPSLFDRVTSRDGEQVVIRRRDGGREAVLVSRAYVAQLEQRTRRGGPGARFRLIGSAELLAPADDFLASLRAGAAQATDRRLRELAPRRRS